jgi:hypothetical protein
MFSMCENMKWSHLPVAGGLYDQDPDLLEGFQIIFHERAEWEAEQEAKRKADEKRKMGSSTRSRASRPRR